MLQLGKAQISSILALEKDRQSPGLRALLARQRLSQSRCRKPNRQARRYRGRGCLHIQLAPLSVCQVLPGSLLVWPRLSLGSWCWTALIWRGGGGCSWWPTIRPPLAPWQPGWRNFGGGSSASGGVFYKIAFHASSAIAYFVSPRSCWIGRGKHFLRRCMNPASGTFFPKCSPDQFTDDVHV